MPGGWIRWSSALGTSRASPTLKIEPESLPWTPAPNECGFRPLLQPPALPDSPATVTLGSLLFLSVPCSLWGQGLPPRYSHGSLPVSKWSPPERVLPWPVTLIPILVTLQALTFFYFSSPLYDYLTPLYAFICWWSVCHTKEELPQLGGFPPVSQHREQSWHVADAW